MERGDAGWVCEERHYARLCRDCRALGIEPNTMSITVALREAFKEISVADLSTKPEKSYAGLEPDQTLYVARWTSKRLGKTCYLKFANNCGLVEIEIFTFHEDNPKGQQP